MTHAILLDPTAELQPARRRLTPRLTSLAGAVVGLLDISKPRGKEFLDAVESLLAAQGATVKRYAKPTFTRVAPAALLRRIEAECDAAVEALAD